MATCSSSSTVRGYAAAGAPLTTPARRAARPHPGPVRIAVTENGARLLCVHVLDPLVRAGIEIELIGGNAMVDLSKGDADLAIRVVRPEAEDLIRRRIGTLRYGLFAARGYLKRAPTLEAGWPGQGVLLPSGELAGGPEATFLRHSASRARIVMHANSHVALACAAEAGLGLVVLPTNLAIFHTALERVRALTEIPERPIWLVMHRSYRADVRLRKAATILSKAFATLESKLANA
ncbi:MAG: hypothetical protein FJ137_08440 [Deltaproteobacteria bacterium]|nr:hypothetical protein [Deltaproteobacteria bacterium]